MSVLSKISRPVRVTSRKQSYHYLFALRDKQAERQTAPGNMGEAAPESCIMKQSRNLPFTSISNGGFVRVIITCLLMFSMETSAALSALQIEQNCWTARNAEAAGRKKKLPAESNFVPGCVLALHLLSIDYWS